MSNLLSGIDAAAPDVAEKDVIFSGGLPDSGLYPGTVTLAFLTESQKGAVALNLHFTADDKRKIKTVIYFTSGNDKGKKTYYEKDGERFNLPGYTTVEALSLMTAGEPFLEAAKETDEITVKLYDFDAKAEVPKRVVSIPAMMGERVTLGIVKSTENKRAKNDSTGKYEPIADTRDVIEIDKVFQDETGLTVNEITAGEEEAVFIQKWEERFAGKTMDKTDKNITAKSGGGSSASNGGGENKPKSKLFGNKK